jgi:hypothetical protein
VAAVTIATHRRHTRVDTTRMLHLSPRAIALFVTALLGTACVIPPVRVTGGGGGGAGQVVTIDHSGKREDSGHARLGDLHASVTPLALADHPSEALDLGLGWFVDAVRAPGGRPGVNHGPFAELAWFPPSLNHHRGLHLGPSLRVEGVYDASDHGLVGGGVAASMMIETYGRVDGPMFLGVTRGAIGIGLSVTAGVRQVDDGSYAYALLSVDVLLPFMAGLPVPAEAVR